MPPMPGVWHHIHMIRASACFDRVRKFSLSWEESVALSIKARLALTERRAWSKDFWKNLVCTDRSPKSVGWFRQICQKFPLWCLEEQKSGPCSRITTSSMCGKAESRHSLAEVVRLKIQQLREFYVAKCKKPSSGPNRSFWMLDDKGACEATGVLTFASV